MPTIPLQCSNILYDQPFDTDSDFTVSFSYNFSLNGDTSTVNNGFSVFFIDGNINPLIGGGCGAGLGVVSGTDVTSTSSVSGVFLAIGFDKTGDFCKVNGIPPFTTGTITTNPSSIGLRITTDFTYITSVDNFYPTFFSNDTDQTVRVRLRKKASELLVDVLNNQTYQNLLTCKTLLSSVPQIAKFGIGYSGETYFQVKNITVNYTN